MDLTCEKFLEAFAHAPRGTALLLDVRNDDEVAEGVLAEAVHIPLPDLPARLSELPREKTIFIYCRSGARAARAKEYLQNAGYPNVVVASGGGYTHLAALAPSTQPSHPSSPRRSTP